ncbi:hypothetical protein BAK_A0228 (plasmid) [Bacillus anthracis str. A0389]|nr:hypothetical protein BAA_A0094 [Bacillus anthracis str. A0248]AHK41713.1 hypothetical protein BAPAT_pXO10093 [Bacillus anthracis str. SVA11]EDR85227.1 hypothetical protein BAQ_A0018 [Bacillus anthracis str. A0193]EDR90525.1 hypothetical protein BAH_A0035 [Bacillus anthracis str. A0442]EDS94411.1 hypothetical protein BAK_A0228 [Bacillus anthracis str. A0389]EDT16937.1 hypothetical protein BAM_A0017 [Bacillus anthracis str. A0465]EDT64838.1 hypothetical protein BAO_A0081 [Bacillus anthracis 
MSTIFEGGDLIDKFTNNFRNAILFRMGFILLMTVLVIKMGGY